MEKRYLIKSRYIHEIYLGKVIRPLMDYYKIDCLRNFVVMYDV